MASAATAGGCKTGPVPAKTMRSRFDPSLRERKFAAFDIERTSSAGFTNPWTVPGTGETRQVYGNVNFSVYSTAPCNGRCPFCVERVRPAAHGRRLDEVKGCLPDDQYFRQLRLALDAAGVLRPSLSITGGEPSIDPRLPRILAMIGKSKTRKRTMTTNASGLLPNRLIPGLASAGFTHLNISRAHFDEARNQDVMRMERFVSNAEIGQVVREARSRGMRPRLSCVLLRDAISSRGEMDAYLRWAGSIGVDNVVFRQLMGFGTGAARGGDEVIAYSNANRVPLEPLLPGPDDASFTFTRQVVGYYYYVEVFTHASGIDVAFEIADLAWARRARARDGTIHELVFHPGGTLNDSWLPWEGMLLDAGQSDA